MDYPNSPPFRKFEEDLRNWPDLQISTIYLRMPQRCVYLDNERGLLTR